MDKGTEDGGIYLAVALLSHNEGWSQAQFLARVKSSDVLRGAPRPIRHRRVQTSRQNRQDLLIQRTVQKCAPYG